MIQLNIVDPIVRRALVTVLATLGPVCAGGELEEQGPSAAAGRTADPASAPPRLVVSDRMLPTAGVPILLLGAGGIPLPVRAADLVEQARQLLLRAAAGEDAPVESLTAREAELLAALAAVAPMAVMRDDLLQKVWGYDPQAETHTIETHIYRLRQKLELLRDGRRIVTVPGGYRLETAE